MYMVAHSDATMCSVARIAISKKLYTTGERHSEVLRRLRLHEWVPVEIYV